MLLRLVTVSSPEIQQPRLYQKQSSLCQASRTADDHLSAPSSTGCCGEAFLRLFPTIQAGVERQLQYPEREPCCSDVPGKMA